MRWSTGSSTVPYSPQEPSSLTGLPESVPVWGRISFAPRQTRIGTPAVSEQDSVAVPSASVPAFTAISSAMPV